MGAASKKRIPQRPATLLTCLLFAGQICYNAGFTKWQVSRHLPTQGNGPALAGWIDMADAIVTIPLPGQPMARQAGSEDDHNGRAVVGHFLAGPENQLLEPAIHGVLQRRPALYNPLVLHGPSGTGKSHLARGLLAAWRDRFPPASVVYTTAVDFARELADAIETQAVADLRANIERPACWCSKTWAAWPTNRLPKSS